MFNFRSNHVTRRQFIQLGKLGIVASLGLVIIPKDFLLTRTELIQSNKLIEGFIEKSNNETGVLPPNQQGRVLSYYIDIYDKPTFSGSKINRFWRDAILPLTDITIGKSEDSFNLVWYKIGAGGYAHSGDIQPVLTNTNPIISDIPKGGALAEVTVPFTDAHWDPGEDAPVTYRFYYATTLWIIEFVYDTKNNPWYGVKDDKWDYIYYLPAAHLRLVPPEEIKPISPGIPPDQKHIEVHLSEQVLIAYEFDQPVFMARTATGAMFSNGDFSTPPGSYSTFHKRPSRHMARGNLAANGYDLPGVPWNSYITEEGIAIHGTYWHNNFGRPRSHGCINLTPQAAKWVFLWTTPPVPYDQEWVYEEESGTTVDIIE